MKEKGEFPRVINVWFPENPSPDGRPRKKEGNGIINIIIKVVKHNRDVSGLLHNIRAIQQPFVALNPPNVPVINTI